MKPNELIERLESQTSKGFEWVTKLQGAMAMQEACSKEEIDWIQNNLRSQYCLEENVEPFNKRLEKLKQRIKGNEE